MVNYDFIFKKMKTKTKNKYDKNVNKTMQFNAIKQY